MRGLAAHPLEHQKSSDRRPEAKGPCPLRLRERDLLALEEDVDRINERSMRLVELSKRRSNAPLAGHFMIEEERRLRSKPSIRWPLISSPSTNLPKAPPKAVSLTQRFSIEFAVALRH